jgi:uncharacterized protein (DUF1697 family)
MATLKSKMTPPETYIALLRGINVSGKNLIKMDALKKSMESIGFANVRTYIQSGNILFDIENATSSQISQLIINKIDKDFGIQLPVMVKTLEEWESAIKENPFLPEYSDALDCLHLTFLEKQPEESMIQKILPLQNGPDHCIILEDRIYLYCPEGYGRTKFTNTYFENKLKAKATTRNWKTILKLKEIATTKVQ